MSAFWPSGVAVLCTSAALFCALLLLGFVMTSSKAVRPRLSWLLLPGVVVLVERIASHEPPGLRMALLLGFPLLTMKILVTIKARAEGTVARASAAFAFSSSVHRGHCPAYGDDTMNV